MEITYSIILTAAEKENGIEIYNVNNLHTCN
jgi:hypothetical protein